MTRKEILINQLFAGKYLSEGENIGHEVINLFKDDEGHHNIFITPNGSVKGHDLEYVLFVRNVSARRTVEIVGLAKGLNPVSDEEVAVVRYAGVSLNRIFAGNIIRGKSDTFQNHVTFRTSYFLVPKERVFLTLEDRRGDKEYVHLNSERQVIVPQGMREYYSIERDPKAYRILKKLIEDTDCWKEKEGTGKLLPDGNIYNTSPSFLEVIRKEDDENIISNLMAYYFEYSQSTFKRFAERVLGIKDMLLPITVERETEKRIDICIKSKTDIIAIENKIKSGINGVDKDNNDSQLNTYYNYTEEEAKKTGRHGHCFVFAPDYSKIELSKYGMDGAYKIINYSEIYKFFVEETESFIADRFFPDFLRGLKRHTLSFPELQFETMRSRLLRRVSLFQQNYKGSE